MSENGDPDLRQGAKAAAAAAAVGAAVGVARALAAKHGHDDEDERHEPERQPHEPEDREQEQPDEPEQPEQREQREQPEPEPVPPHGEGVDRLRRVTQTARELLQELSGAEVEAVSALDRTSAGWRVTLEAVELRRIPDSTDVLATYEVELDGDGDLVRYERRRRYARSQADHGDGR